MDDEEQSDLSIEGRLEAERRMRKRDRDEGLIAGKRRRGLLYGKRKSRLHLTDEKQLLLIFFVSSVIFVQFWVTSQSYFLLNSFLLIEILEKLLHNVETAT